MYLEVLVIADYLDNILFCHYSKIIFEYDSLAIFAGTTQKYSCLPPPPLLYILNGFDEELDDRFNDKNIELWSVMKALLTENDDFLYGSRIYAGIYIVNSIIFRDSSTTQFNL